jgi:hypothetical protein
MRTDRNPVMRLHINSSAVTIMFSGSEDTDVKNKVRDILTEAYEERFQKEFIPCGQAL